MYTANIQLCDLPTGMQQIFQTLMRNLQIYVYYQEDTKGVIRIHKS